MRVREVRKDVWRSLATAVRIRNRSHLVRHISVKLRKDGAQIPDDLIHVTPYGYDDRIGWNDHIIVVEGFGVFGFADAPCPPLTQLAQDVADLDGENVFAELECAFAPAHQPRLQRFREFPH